MSLFRRIGSNAWQFDGIDHVPDNANGAVCCDKVSLFDARTIKMTVKPFICGDL